MNLIRKLYILIGTQFLFLAVDTYRRTSTNGGLRCFNLGPISKGRVVVYRPRKIGRSPGVRVSHSSEFPAGTQLRYSCEDGYALMGSKRLVCKPTGFWNTNPPICVEECGRATSNIHHQISLTDGEWPWVVSISTSIGNYTGQICTGTLLDRRTILTAGHCAEVSRKTRFTLYFGKVYRTDEKDDDKVKKRMSTRVIMHPDYNFTIFDNDLAIMRFRPDIPYSDRIQPVCLPTPQSTAKNLVPGNMGFVTGWGFITENTTGFGVASDKILVSHAPVQTDEKCSEIFAEKGMPYTSLLRGQFCAGFEMPSDNNICRILSGSPFVFFDELTSRYVMEGLVSFGVSRCGGVPKAYTYFMKVLEYMPWIVEKLL